MLNSPAPKYFCFSSKSLLKNIFLKKSNISSFPPSHQLPALVSPLLPQLALPELPGERRPPRAPLAHVAHLAVAAVARGRGGHGVHATVHVVM